uniref:CCHC-type domain-containing protein n=1 Tax=Nelumbo nucifera TaxID=4432 RepID=A0A822YDT4_NELNU|nr:TPA_asm: hypothetical protein HUJ06_031139 [Nelumbo nucifera]
MASVVLILIDDAQGSGRGRPQCTYCGDKGHWVQKCYQLHGYPPGHPKAKNTLGSNQFGKPAANHVSKGYSKEEEKPIVGISEAQLQQLLSLLSIKNEGSSPQANAVTKPSLSKITSHNWIIDSGATDHISSSSKLFSHKNKACSLPSVLLPSGQKANIVAKGSLPLNSVYSLHDDLDTKRMIGLGKQHDKLYYLVALATKKFTNPSSSTNFQPTCNLTTSSTDL